MRARLDQLFGNDRAVRWRMIISSALVITAWGAFSELSQKSAYDSQVGATVAGVLVFCIQVCAYCLAGDVKASLAENLIPRRLAMAAGLLFLISIVPTAILKAEITRKLLKATEDGDVSPEKAREIAEAVGLASRYVRLPRKPLIVALNSIKITAEKDSGMPDLARAADALENYARLISPDPSIVGSHNGAVEAFYRGRYHVNEVLHGGRREAEAAIPEFTRAFDLADGDTDLKANALMSRAGTYNLLEQYAEALRDAQKAEELGSLELGLIATVEGQALVHLSRSGEDLKRAIGLITLRLEMRTKLQEAHRFYLLHTRAEAYYGLGRFENVIEDYKVLLKMKVPPEPPGFSNLGAFFATLVFTYLRLGSVDDALRADAELGRLTNDPRLEAIHAILQDHRTDPDTAIAMIKEIAPEPRMHLR